MRSFKITLIWSEVENDCLLIEKRPFIHKSSRTPQHRHEICVHTHKCIGNGPVQTQKICMDVTTVKCELTKPQTDSITVLTFLHTIPAEIYGCYYRKIRINKETDRHTDRHLQKSYVEGPVQNNEKTKIENVVSIPYWTLTGIKIR